MNQYHSPPVLVMREQEVRRLRRKSRLNRAVAKPMTMLLVLTGLPFTTVGWLSEKCLDGLQGMASLTVHRMIRSARAADEQAEEILMLPAPQSRPLLEHDRPRRAVPAPMVNADDHWESVPLPQVSSVPTPEHWGKDYNHYVPAVEARFEQAR
jgi:hypothetical protein